MRTEYSNIRGLHDLQGIAGQGRNMTHRILCSLTIFLHFLWIIFLIFGFLFALKRPVVAWIHAGGLLFSLFLNLSGLYCPLTYLENYFHVLHDIDTSYTGPFIINFLEGIIYPDLPERYIRTGEILFVCLYLIGYFSYYCQRSY